MPPTGPDRKRTLWILALLVALALVLRLGSAGRLLPQQREPDAFEVYEMQRVQHDPALVKGVNFQERYPWLLAWSLAALPVVQPPREASAADAEQLHLAAAARPFVRVRIAVALLATLQVLLTFFLARRFLPEGAALAAVFLVATSLLHLLFSVEARPHGANAGLSLLALLAALQLGQRLAFGRLALAVVTSAAAIATFQLGMATLPPLFLACLLLEGVPRGKRVALALLAPLCAFALALPWYTNRPYVDATGIHMASAEGGGHVLFFSGMDFLGSLRAAQLVFEHDPLLALLAAAGIVLALAVAPRFWRAADRDARRTLLVAGAFALPYLLVITIQGEVYERFLMPLVPFVAVFGALALRELWRMAALRALAPAALGLAAVPALQFVRLAQLPDSYEQAAGWVRQNVPRESNVTVFPDVSLPLLYAPAAVAAQMQDISARNMPWVTYQATIPALPAGAPAWNVRCVPRQLVVQRATVETMRAWLSAERVEYLVVEHSRKMTNLPALENLEQAASETGELVFASAGAAPDWLELGSADYQMIRYFAWRQLRQGALGPELRIWRIRRP